KPTISPERYEKAVGETEKSLELATCRFCYSELQLCFASSQWHWAHLERMVCDRFLKHAGCSMPGTRRCFISSYTQSRCLCLRSTGPSTGARACCCLWGFYCLAGVCICLRLQISAGWVQLLPLAVCVCLPRGCGWFLRHRRKHSDDWRRAQFAF